jgi:hypothetical protein
MLVANMRVGELAEHIAKRDPQVSRPAGVEYEGVRK